MQRNSTSSRAESNNLTNSNSPQTNGASSQSAEPGQHKDDSPKREAFIPLNRRELIELCIDDRQISASDAQHFRDFCEILSAYFHFQFHGTLESIKENYAPFNPNIDVQSRYALCTGQSTPYPPAKLREMQDTLVADFRHLLEKSNYIELSKRTLRRAMEERSLIPLHTDVNFKDFQTLVCYYRGDIHQDIEEKGFLGRKKIRTINIFERVVLLIQFKDESYFKKKGIDPETLNYIPGKIYLYFYKDVPKYDLELLFPNVKTSMTWRDRLMLLVPAIGAGIGIIIKVLPQLIVIVAAIAFAIYQTTQTEPPLWLSRNHTQTDSILPLLVTILSFSVALGGFAAKQYSNYKSKKIQFQKHVTDTLFFRSMANHSAVFQLLVDVAEEEECKEVILAYYHLLISKQSLSAHELDQAVEKWMGDRLNIDVDFDIQDALNKLHRLKESIEEYDAIDGSLETKAAVKKMALVELDENRDGNRLYSKADKRYRARSLPQAKQIIDRLWDNAFQYASPRKFP
ncbi:MAG: TMEM143 family protein [Cyanobacteria bacterium P01_F01_bin.150]